jgi:uncharacterized protein YkwD
MAVGAFVGMELGGSTAAAPTTTPAGTATPATPTPSAGPAAGTATATATAASTPTATATPTPRPDIDAAAVEREVANAVNDRRADRDLQELVAIDQIREMARFHSENMAAQGYLSHAAAGYTAAERYEEYGLADRCRVADDSGTGIREDDELEVLGVVRVGPNGTNESQLAASAVETWFDDQEPRQRLTYRNADQVGVGVEVTDTGRVFLTVNLC